MAKEKNEKTSEEVLDTFLSSYYEPFSKEEIAEKLSKSKKWKSEFLFEDAFNNLLEMGIIKQSGADKFEVVKLKIRQEYRDGFYAELKKRNKPKTIKKNPFSERKISVLSDIRLAMNEIYIAGVPFKRGSHCLDLETHKGMLDSIAEKIHNYFVNPGNVENNQEKFDEFHRELCYDFLAAYNGVKNPEDDGPTFGNAQKQINMTFKYLACYSDYDTYSDLLSYCHIPIDRIILDSLRTIYGVEDISNDLKYKYHDDNRNKKLGDYLSWSAFDSYEMYTDLVTKYRLAMRGTASNNYNIGRNSWLAADFILLGSVFPKWKYGGKRATKHLVEPNLSFYILQI